MTETEIDYVSPQWSAPFHVRALTTLRLGGYSKGDYQGLNLADHVGDDAAHVAKNRSLIRSSAGCPADPHWLEQVHGSQVVQLDDGDFSGLADGSISLSRGAVCAVLSADCVPLFITDRPGQFVALLHVVGVDWKRELSSPDWTLFPNRWPKFSPGSDRRLGPLSTRWVMMCGGDCSRSVGIMTVISPELRRAGWQICQEWSNSASDALV
jgi:hypothetical protein